MTGWKMVVDREILDAITREHTGFESFYEIVNAAGNYRPTIQTTNPYLKLLADAYDQVQAASGDPRRAYRRG